MAEQINGLTISIPADKVDQKNLENLCKAKGKLIKKALGGCDGWTVEDGNINFNWHTKVEPDEIRAYTVLISKICERTLKARISAKKKEVENEKYSFRCFLLGLGMIGEQYKAERKILLGHFDGSASYKKPKAKEEWA